MSVLSGKILDAIHGQAKIQSDSWSIRQIRRIIDSHKELQAQLPESMQHCTILVKQCKVGHTWLTATNWIQHPCFICELRRLEAELDIIPLTRAES